MWVVSSLIRRIRRAKREAENRPYCGICYGSGTYITNVDRDGTVYVGTCPHCEGTGRL